MFGPSVHFGRRVRVGDRLESFVAFGLARRKDLADRDSMDDAPDVANAKHLGPQASSGAKRAVGLGQGLPDEVLAEVLNFSGLREFGACAAASQKLRRVLLERLSPVLGHKLVLRRFPILALMFEGAETTELPPPRELFESQLRMTISTPTRYAPTRGLDDYTFFLEVELRESTDGQTTNTETLWAGKGSLASGGFVAQFASFHSSHGGVEFNLPDEVFELFDDVWSTGNRGLVRRTIRVNIMAARRSSEGMQRAMLGCSPPDDHENWDGDNGVYIFYDMTYPLYSTLWHQHKTVEADCYHLPAVRGEFSRGDPESHPDLAAAGPPRFYFSFVWSDPGGDTEMTVEDACLALEHYYTWV